MTPSTRSAPHPVAVPRWRRAAALILGLAGLEAIVYSPFLPVPADLAGLVVVGPLAFGYVATALGIVGIAAAVGVWSSRAWGRIAGLLVVVVFLAYRVWLSLQRTDGPTAPVDQIGWLLAGLAVPVAASAFVLFVLARRWVPAG